MRPVAEGLYVVETAQRFAGIEVGTRMTALHLAGGWLVHSPVAIDPSTVAGPETTRWVLAPNLLHHLHVGPWIDAGWQAWAARGLPEKRPDLKFAGVISADHPFGDELAIVPTTCFPFANEVVVLHRPSRTLILTDLAFNIQSSAPLLTRAAMTCVCAYPGVRSSLLERVGMKRPVAREELGAILALDFDRIILSHGDIVETNGKAALRNAYAWLGL